MAFWKTLPGFLTALATFIGAVTALIVVFYDGGKSDKSTGDTGHADTSAGVTDHNGSPTPGPAPTQSCEVSGIVYNNDNLPNVLPAIKIAYLAAGSSNVPPTPIATTSPAGHFTFSCSQIPAADFPIHLQMTYVWSGGSQVVQSEDRIFVSGNSDVNLYLSPQEITNWHRINAFARPMVMPITSLKLLHNYSTATVTGNDVHLTNRGVSVLPANIRIPRNIILTPH